MQEQEFENLLRKLVKYGVAHREELKHYSRPLDGLLKKKWVEKLYQRGKVFYAFTPAALPFLEDYRQRLVSELKALSQVFPRKKVYVALLGDLRFLDETAPVAEAYRFLSDWQLNQRVVPSQLALSKARFFERWNASNS
jgi:hypothetical protein